VSRKALAEPQMKRVELKRGVEELLSEKRYTIYSKWVSADSTVSNGDFVEVYFEGELVGYGFYEKVGAVGLRILAYVSEEPPSDLEGIVKWRIEKAERRRKLAGESASSGYRLVYADSDGMPGLVVDVYGDTAVVQSTSYGWDKNSELLARCLVEAGVCSRVYLKNDQRARKQFGMPVERRFLVGSGPPEVVIFEGRAKLIVNFEKGQKTGFYLDQRPARLRVSSLDLSGAKVLDLFSYTGAFSVHTLLAGASEAVMIEESAEALETAVKNMELNGLDSFETICGRVERVLDSLVSKRRSFDVVIADPPAFIPSKEDYEKGLAAYKKLYESVFKLVKPGGLVYASSCSYALSPQAFLDLLKQTASSRGLQARVLYENTPFNATPYTRIQDDELRYLKGYLLLVE